jgi:hypothetical protein
MDGRMSYLILYVSGKEARRWPVPESQQVVRFRVTHEINLVIDGYAVVRVDGDKIMAPVVGDHRTFGVYPLALTNPIFFDVNGNGQYDPEHEHGTHHCLKSEVWAVPRQPSRAAREARRGRMAVAM